MTMPDKSSSPRAPPSIQRSIQYTVSPKEYTYLHNRYIKRLSPASRSKLPSPEVYTKAIESRGDFNAATIRVFIRAFLAIQAIFKIYDFVVAKLAARKGQRSGQFSYASNLELTKGIVYWQSRSHTFNHLAFDSLYQLVWYCSSIGYCIGF